jgi:nicotinamide riboside kinase
MEKTISHQLIKIAVVGPESTGKSTLAAALAQSFNTLWVKEFAREYCEQLKEECTLADELAIFNGQLKAEEKCIEDLMSLNNSPAILITDTTILNVKVWCEHVFGTAPAIVKQTCDTRKYDLYFLMKYVRQKF